MPVDKIPSSATQSPATISDTTVVSSDKAAEKNPVGISSANAPVMTDESVKMDEDVPADPTAPDKKPDQPVPIPRPRSDINILAMQQMISQITIDDGLLQMSSSKITMDSMQKTNKSLADKQIKQMEDQAQKQQQADKKSGIFSWVSKIFTALTVVVAVALIATGVGAGFGIGLLVGLAAGQLLQIDAVKNAIVKAVSAVFGEKVGAILANVVILAVQIAIAIKSGNLGAALAKGSNIMKAVSNVAAKVIKGLNDVDKAKNTLMKVNTTVQATGGITQGGMQIDIGVTNIQLANLKRVVQDNKADMSFLTGLIDQTLALQKQATDRLSQNLQETLSQVASYSSYNRSWS
jgi:hypothetical protein